MKIYLCWGWCLAVWLLDGDMAAEKKGYDSIFSPPLLMCFLTQSGGKLKRKAREFLMNEYANGH